MLIAHRYIGIMQIKNRTYYIFKGDNTDYIEGIPFSDIDSVLRGSWKSRIFRLIRRDGCMDVLPLKSQRDI